MGNEVLTRIEIGAESGEAKALLETGELIVRGAVKAKIPFNEMKDVRGEDGVLSLRWTDRDVRIHVGRDAAKWAEKIRNPKSVLDKLGVKSGQKIAVIGEVDGAFTELLEARGAEVVGKLRPERDLIFFAVTRREELTRLEELRRALQPAGAIWVLRPKGSANISERDVMASGKAAGLVDVKVVRFSETHTAEKLVIPTAKRA
jgi:hypothetical protein